MKHDDLDKRVSAYVDGALRGAKRDQLERELEADSHLARQVDRSRALGRLVRDAWNEGPAAPAPEFLIAAIRPALAEIDRERNMRPGWQRALDSVFARLTASWLPSPAFATATAVAFVAALALMPRFELTSGMLDGSLFKLHASAPQELPFSAAVGGVTATPMFSPAQAGWSAEAPPTLDVAPNRPAMLFHSTDGSSTLWLIDPGDLSFLDSLGGYG